MLDTVCEQMKNNRNGYSIRQSENDTTGVYWTNKHLGDWMYAQSEKSQYSYISGFDNKNKYTDWSLDKP